MFDPNMNNHYATAPYWEERYSKRWEPFDWYMIYPQLKDILSLYITKTDKILNVGCGNSTLGQDMYEDGYEEITNIDTSFKVIGIMEEATKDKYPKMVYKVMDVMDMKDYITGDFNVVIDKGALDAILCGDNCVLGSQKMISEIYRILPPGGYYICISYGDPEHRRKYFNKMPWEAINVDKIEKLKQILVHKEGNEEEKENKEESENEPKSFYYIYTMIKGK